MTNATYTADPVSTVNFYQVIDALDGLSDGSVTNPTVTTCAITMTTDEGTVVATVTGTGFTYMSTPDLSLVGGTITGISFALDGVHQGDISTSLAVSSFANAAAADESGDSSALEHFLMGFNWTYHGNDSSELSPGDATIGDDVPFNLTGNDTISLFGGNDVFFAGDGSDTINGGDGNDQIDGGDGSDTINGGAGEDEIYGGQGSDTINGGDDADVLTGGAGNDTLNGGTGGDDFDDVWYHGEGGANGVSVDLAAGTATDTYGNTDTLISIEGIAGTDQADTLRGSDADNIIRSFRGNDIVDGRGGNDEVHYGNDQNLLSVTVDLVAGTGVEHYADGTTTDTLISIERIRGSHGGDSLAGDDGDNRFRGLAGNDTIDGRGGRDLVDYNNDAQSGGNAGVTVNLALGTATDGFGNTDTLANIEDARGTRFNDTLTGDIGENQLLGGDGNDTINGGSVASSALSDFLDGGAGNDTLTLIGQGQAIGGQGDDRIIGLTSGDADNIDYAQADYSSSTAGIVANLTAASHGGLAGGNVANGFRVADGLGGTDLISGLHVISDSNFNDTIYVDSTWTNSFGSWLELNLGSGDDHVEGDGSVFLRLNYSGAGGAVNIDLAAGTATDLNPGNHFIGMDTFTGVTDARGTSFDDTIAGTDGEEQLRGRDGNDTLYGGGGNDILYGDEKNNPSFAGDDRLDGGAGADQMYGGGGDDTYYVDNAGDNVFEAIAGGGSDIVYSSVNYTLTAGAEVELLRSDDLSATGALNLTGNEFGQAIYGNAGANIIDGKAGADNMQGLGGNDIYYVDNIGDRVIEAANGGSDRVYSSVNYTLAAGAEVELLMTDNTAGTGTLNLTGNELGQTIYGNAGANTIDGKAGADTMQGLGGNDIYYVDNAGDKVIEAAGGGTDRVLSSIGYTLTAGQEIETFTTTATAGTGALNLTGNEFAQTIGGNNGANIIDGKGGADAMYGYGGNDIYFVDSALDRVIEAAGGGADRVLASASYALAAGSEVETLMTGDTAGTGALNLTGNEFGQAIYGNAGANTIDGKAGADIMYGLGGNDIYFVDSALDHIFEAAGGGSDRVYSSVSYTLGAGVEVELLMTDNTAGTGTLNLTGNEFGQAIYGNAGANTIDGKAGADTMYGLGGNDIYFVDSALDRIFEAANGGSDRVLASVSYTLTAGAQIETFTTTNTAGTGALNLTGNEFGQVIGGNNGANIIDGKAGADTMQGFGGNDTYYVDNALDRIFEAANGGSDRVLSSVSYALTAGAEVETFTTTATAGTGALNLTGNELAQVIGGNNGANIIDGKGGADTLYGFGGHDSFAFSSALGATNIDTIADFSVADDTILLAHAIFTGLGASHTLDADAFVIGSAAGDASDRIIYNSTTGNLYFDDDGSGVDAAQQFAHLSAGLALTNADFYVA